MSWIVSGGWKWAGMAAGLITSIILILLLRLSHAENEALTIERDEAQAQTEFLIEARANDARVLASRGIARATIKEAQHAASIKTREALDANPEWATQPVPPSILGSLHQTTQDTEASASTGVDSGLPSNDLGHQD